MSNEFLIVTHNVQTGIRSERLATPLELATHLASHDPEFVLAECKAAVDAHFNAVAQEQRYDSLLSIATYLTSSNPLWQAQAVAFFAWRDECVAIVNDLLNFHTERPEEPLPTPEVVLAALPTITWPTA